MLELRNVTYGYEKNEKVLQGVSLTFAPGKFYTIFGPSGSGKTTCLSLLGGLDTPQQGQVLLDGRDIKEIGYNYLRKKVVCYVFQDFHLFTHMNAVENVMAAISIADKHVRKKEAERKALEALLALGLEEKDLKRKVSKLSGGQQQRVAIARALAVDSSYILADEPTGNLDAGNTENILCILRRLVDEYGKCVIAVTHSLKVRDASDICYEFGDGGRIRQAEVRDGNR